MRGILLDTLFFVVQFLPSVSGKADGKVFAGAGFVLICQAFEGIVLRVDQGIHRVYHDSPYPGLLGVAIEYGLEDRDEVSKTFTGASATGHHKMLVRQGSPYGLFLVAIEADTVSDGEEALHILAVVLDDLPVHGEDAHGLSLGPKGLTWVGVVSTSIKEAGVLSNWLAQSAQRRVARLPPGAWRKGSEAISRESKLTIVRLS